MNRALRPCLKHGCNKLVASGYCVDHKPTAPDRSSFVALDEKKTPEQKKFYSSSLWVKVSRLYRVAHPLCERCRNNGKIVASVLVHHNPTREELVKRGLNPYNPRYLEALCLSCHQKELRAKRA